MKIGHSLEVKHSWLLWSPWAAFALGFLMNAVVMALNSGQMPVMMPADTCYMLDGDRIHSCMTAATHLKIFADWIVVKDVGIFSPGDFFELAQDLFCLPFLLVWATLQIRCSGGYSED